MTRILLLRHGQSEANKAHIFVGQTDVPLSELGLAQAERTADYILSNYQVDKVYASDLKRAYQTGKAVADRLGMPVITDPDLRELHCGIWEGAIFNDMLAKGEQFFVNWIHDIGSVVCPGGESMADLQERASKAMDRIARENDGKTVVVAAHATMIRAVMCLYAGKTLPQMKEIAWVTNASVTELVYEDGKMSIVSAGKDDHLGELLFVWEHAHDK